MLYIVTLYKSLDTITLVINADNEKEATDMALEDVNQYIKAFPHLYWTTENMAISEMDITQRGVLLREDNYFS